MPSVNEKMSMLVNLKRPQILVQAARIALADFNRTHSLRRLLPGAPVPSAGLAFDDLFAREAAIEAVRLEGGAAYSAARHVEVLTALIIEARLAGARKTA